MDSGLSNCCKNGNPLAPLIIGTDTAVLLSDSEGAAGVVKEVLEDGWRTRSVPLLPSTLPPPSKVVRRGGRGFILLGGAERWLKFLPVGVSAGG